MELTRRKLLAIGASTFAIASITGASAYASLTDDAIAALTGGAEAGEGAITITAPEIAENGKVKRQMSNKAAFVLCESDAYGNN